MTENFEKLESWIESIKADSKSGKITTVTQQKQLIEWLTELKYYKQKKSEKCECSNNSESLKMLQDLKNTLTKNNKEKIDNEYLYGLINGIDFSLLILGS